MPTRSGTRDKTMGGSTRGTLADVPLAHALVYIRAKRLTGVLDLRAPAKRHGWVVFFRGSIVSVSTTPTIARFGAVVYELGFIGGGTLDETMVESTRARRPQAEILLERGDITPLQHKTVLEEQACRRVHHLFTFPTSTQFTFRESRPSATEPDVMVDVLTPVWRALVDFPPTAKVREVLDIVGTRTIHLLSEAALERAGLSEAEIALCQELTARPYTLSELRAATSLPTARVDLLVYLLLISRCAEPQGAGRPAAESQEMWAVRDPQAPTTTRDDVPAANARVELGAAPMVAGPADLGVDGVLARAASIATETPCQALGLPEGASEEAARAAFYRLSRLWHPARLPAGLEPARSAAALVFEHMKAAHVMLTDRSRNASRA